MASRPPKQRKTGEEVDGKYSAFWRKLYFGLDVEKAGKHQNDSLIAVGIAVFAVPEGILEKRRWCMPNVTRFEPRCISEFWGKHADLLTELVAEGQNKNALEQFRSIESFLDKWEMETLPARQRVDLRTCASYNGKAVLVSDNPAFDLYHFDAAMEALVPDHNPLHYTRTGIYRSVEDSSERIEAQGMDWNMINTFLLSIGVTNSHRPEDDAEKIAWLHIISRAYTFFCKANQSKSLVTINCDFHNLFSTKDKAALLRYAALQDGMPEKDV